MIWFIIAFLVVLLLGLSGQEGERSAGNAIVGGILLITLLVLLVASC